MVSPCSVIFFSNLGYDDFLLYYVKQNTKLKIRIVFSKAHITFLSLEGTRREEAPHLLVSVYFEFDSVIYLIQLFEFDLSYLFNSAI